MTQEFHLLVTPISPEHYLVRTEQVALGVPLAEEQVEWPVDQWLAQAKQVFENPLAEAMQQQALHNNGNLALEKSNRTDEVSVNVSPPPNLVAFGKTLYDALFQGTVRESWSIAQGIAQHRGQVLRLRLGVKGDRLQHLPWEILHDGNRPLACGKDVIFSRYQLQFASITSGRSFSGRVSGALRILMVLAGPSDQANLALKQEALHLQEELTSTELENESKALPKIQLTILEQPGREKLTQTLEQGNFQVFHFAGHSNQGPSGGQLHLVNAKTGLTESLRGDDLAGLLVNNGIWLAVLNSCLGTQAATAVLTDSSDPLGDYRSLAAALIRQGIPAVLAMAERIPDRVALTLSRLFYRNLKFGHPIDLSLCRARQGLISAYGSHQLYWSLPVLHLHSEFEGQLIFNEASAKTSNWQDSAASNLSTESVGERFDNPLLASQVSSVYPIPADPLNPSYVNANHFNSAKSARQNLSSSEAAYDWVAPYYLASRIAQDAADDLLPNDGPSDNLPQTAEHNMEGKNLEDGSLASLIHRLSNLVPEEDRPLKAAHEELLLPDAEQSLELYPDLPLGTNQARSVEQEVSGDPLTHTSSLVAQGSQQVQAKGILTSRDIFTRMPSDLIDRPIEKVSGEDLSGSASEIMPGDGSGTSHATIALHRETIALNPTEYKAYYHLAQALFTQGYLDESIDAYHQVLSLKPNLSEAYRGLGQAWAAQGNCDNAVIAYKQAIALNPNLPDTYRYLQQALAQQGQLEAAVIASPQRLSNTSSTKSSTKSLPSNVAMSLVDQPADNGDSVSSEISINTGLPLSRAQTSPLPRWTLPLWVWLGLTGIVAAATLSLLLVTGPRSRYSFQRTASNSEQSQESANASELNPVEINAMTTQAIQSFNSGNVLVAQEVVERLLDRSALQEAQKALNAVPEEALNDPEVIFLRGRLAWQSLQDGNLNFSVDDARRFWETAVRDETQSVDKLNALGFAYYVEGRFDRAKQSWLKVLAPVDGANATVLLDVDGSKPAEIAQDELMAYAGIALILFKSAEAQPIAQQAQFLNQAQKLYQFVVERESTQFTVANLRENWLWTEGAIEDWQLLGQFPGMN